MGTGPALAAWPPTTGRRTWISSAPATTEMPISSTGGPVTVPSMSAPRYSRETASCNRSRSVGPTTRASDHKTSLPVPLNGLLTRRLEPSRSRCGDAGSAAICAPETGPRRSVPSAKPNRTVSNVSGDGQITSNPDISRSQNSQHRRDTRKKRQTMTQRTRIMLIAGISLLVALAACATTTSELHPSPSSTSPRGEIGGYGELVDALRDAGATVEPVQEVAQPFFAVPGQIIDLNGTQVQVFQQPEAAARNAAPAL